MSLVSLFSILTCQVEDQLQYDHKLSKIHKFGRGYVMKCDTIVKFETKLKESNQIEMN